MSATSTIDATSARHAFSLAHALSPFATLARAVGKAILTAHMRKAEHELARCLERSGGKLTDDVERRMMQSLKHTNFKVD